MSGKLKISICTYNLIFLLLPVFCTVAFIYLIYKALLFVHLDLAHSTEECMHLYKTNNRLTARKKCAKWTLQISVCYDQNMHNVGDNVMVV